jgi:hypothetical protein
MCRSPLDNRPSLGAVSFLDRLRVTLARASSAPAYEEQHPASRPLLSVLDEAAAQTDGGRSFAALCRRVADGLDAAEWADDLERVLWLLDDGLDCEQPGWEALADRAAAEWMVARASGGEGPAAYARRWRGFLHNG